MIKRLWSDEKTALLKELWALDMSGSQIVEIMAKRGMPTPKNAIYKKAQRLGLTPRGSPIISIRSSMTRRELIENSRAKPAGSIPAPVVLEPAPIRPMIDYKAPLISRASKYERGEGCCWPIGDPKKDDFRFCGKKRESRSYCTFHGRMAYVRPLECVSK